MSVSARSGPPCTRFIIVRHGETEWNLQSRLQGHSDSPLTAAGLAQAEALARRLARESFSALISSDLARAYQTALSIAAATGHAVTPEPRLRERNFGEAEGLTYGEMDHQFPEVFSQVRETDPDYVVPGGESRNQLYRRVRDAFESLALEHPGACVAVVTHGGVLASLYRLIHAIPVAVPHRIPIRNASYNAVHCSAGEWSVEVWGDTTHLAETALSETL